MYAPLRNSTIALASALVLLTACAGLEGRDADDDGVSLRDGDCDDLDAAVGDRALDADCDGILTDFDCDDNDPSSTAKADDFDCDGVLTEQDCDDADSSTPNNDADCDGVLTEDDCDDNDPALGARALDPDCDGNAPKPRIVNITGTTTNLLTGATAPEGLCAIAVEPTLALDGGELTVLGQARVDADGKYDIKDVDLDRAPLAIFVMIDDCPHSTRDDVFPTATGILSEDYTDNGAGDTLYRDPFWIDNVTAAGMNQSFALTGSAKTTADGVVIMFVLDKDGNPLPGATVSCAGTGCDTLEAYYLDGDPRDGFFTTAGSVNAATVVGIAALPRGPVGDYTATADGKAFSSSLFGSIPGLAAVTTVQAR